MKKTLFLASTGFLFILFFAINSCRKTEHTTNKEKTEVKTPVNFFDVSPEIEPVILAVADRIKTQDAKKHFTPDLIRRVGYPYWSNSLIADGAGSTKQAAQKGSVNKKSQRLILYIPFAKQNERATKAILRVVINGKDTTFRMLYPQQYLKYGFAEQNNKWNARNLFSLFAGFDYDLFGITSYKVTDGRIFGNKKKDSLFVTVDTTTNITSDIAARMISITECKTTRACAYGSGSAEDYDPGNCKYKTTCTTTWFDDGVPDPLPPTNGGGGSGGSGTGNGNGDDDGWPDNPCPTEAARLDPGTGGGDGGDPCDEVPWVESTVPKIINEVDDPCIKNSVEKVISKNCQNKIATFLNTIFGNSAKFDLTFQDDVFSGVNYSTTDAYTITNGNLISGTNTIIKFNNARLSNASAEYVAATILHEAVHAWINYNYSNNISNDEQHELMASTYRFDLMKTALVEMFPGLSSQDAIALTWGGNQKAIKYQTLSPAEQAAISQINDNYRINPNNAFGTPCP